MTTVSQRGETQGSEVLLPGVGSRVGGSTPRSPRGRILKALQPAVHLPRGDLGEEVSREAAELQARAPGLPSHSRRPASPPSEGAKCPVSWTLVTPTATSRASAQPPHPAVPSDGSAPLAPAYRSVPLPYRGLILRRHRGDNFRQSLSPLGYAF